MKVRNAVLWWVLVGLAAAPAVAAPALSAGQRLERAERAAFARVRSLPACPPAAASTRPPTRPAGATTSGACRAAGHILESAVRPDRRGERSFTPSGYHHLGANTGSEWAGVSGRMSVVDGSVRPRSYDFVATRFMVKRNLGRGSIAWLEAGWAETGWATPGRQHIYTFNTNTKTWQFYDQYALRPGEKVWLDLHADSGGVWSAWLWWGNRWNLLTAQRLPLGPTATIEQYVEVHVDAGRPGLIDVPPVMVDNVRLRPVDGGEPRLWRDDVPTLTGSDPARREHNGGFCLDWLTRYDTWTAGDCGLGRAAPRSSAAPPRPVPPSPAQPSPALSGPAQFNPAQSGPAQSGPAEPAVAASPDEDAAVVGPLDEKVAPPAGPPPASSPSPAREAAPRETRKPAEPGWLGGLLG